jgi:uncharacterized protein (TIGR00645 family)
LIAEDVFGDITHINEATIMLTVLGLIDVVMIANLLIMVIIGGYETFVARLRIDNHPDEPEWLSHVNANVLKVKLAMAIIGISSVGLLRTFIEAGTDGNQQTNDEIMWQVIIHLTFIFSALALAWIDRMYNNSQPHGPAGQNDISGARDVGGNEGGDSPSPQVVRNGA